MFTETITCFLKRVVLKPWWRLCSNYITMLFRWYNEYSMYRMVDNCYQTCHQKKLSSHNKAVWNESIWNIYVEFVQGSDWH